MKFLLEVISKLSLIKREAAFDNNRTNSFTSGKIVPSPSSGLSNTFSVCINVFPNLFNNKDNLFPNTKGSTASVPNLILFALIIKEAFASMFTLP